MSEPPILRSIVRHSLARVISSIASVELPHAQWPELLPFVQGLCEAPSPVHRESGAFILFTILEVVIEGLQDKVADFLNLFRHLLSDPESIEVRLVTVRALGTLAGYIDVDDKPEIVRGSHTPNRLDLSHLFFSFFLCFRKDSRPLSLRSFTSSASR